MGAGQEGAFRDGHAERDGQSGDDPAAGIGLGRRNVAPLAARNNNRPDTEPRQRPGERRRAYTLEP